MHLYKHFFRLIGKNKSGLIIYGCIFIAMIICIAFATSSVGHGDNGVNREAYTIGYTDNDSSVLSKGIIEYLSVDNELVDLKGKDEDSIRTMVYFDVVDYAIEIPENFETLLLRGDDIKIEYCVGTSLSASTYIMNGYIDKYVKNYLSYTMMGKNSEEAAQLAKANMSVTASVERYVEDDKVTGMDGKEIAVYNLINYFAYVSFGAIVVCLGGTLVINSRKGISKRMNTAPISEKGKVITDFIGTFTAGIIIWAMFIIFLMIFGRNSKIVGQYMPAIIIIELAIVAFNCSFAVFVSGFACKNQSLNMISNVVGLSMSFVSGVFVPQYLLGEGVLTVAKFTPFYWLCRCSGTMYGPAESPYLFSGSEVALSVSMIMLFAIAFLFAGIIVRKQKAVA